VLSQGSSPLAFIQEHVQKYVECAKEPSKAGCSDILNPPKKPEPRDEETKTMSKIQFEANRHYA